MTKEELKKEAEEGLDKRLGTYAYINKQNCYRNYVDGYIDGVEPREKQIAELEKENTELKTKKIPQLERKIASIRGAHRVDLAKLNARIEQVERLKKENAELKEKNRVLDCMLTGESLVSNERKHQLDKARELILKLYNAGRDVLMCRADEKAYDNLSGAIDDKGIEQFLSEVKK